MSKIMLPVRTRTMVLLWSFVLLFSVCAHAQPEQRDTATFTGKDKEVVDCIGQGQKAAMAGKLDEAIVVLTSCAEKYPDSGLAAYVLGMAYFQKRDKDKAINQFKRAMQLEPKNLSATAMLGKLYSMDKDKLSLAQELLERVLQASPRNEDVRFDLARVYVQKGELKKGLDEFDVILSGEPKYALYHAELGRILASTGEKKRARYHLERAIALAPDFEPAKKLLEALEKESAAPGEPDKKPK